MSEHFNKYPGGRCCHLQNIYVSSLFCSLLAFTALSAFNFCTDLWKSSFCRIHTVSTYIIEQGVIIRRTSYLCNVPSDRLELALSNQTEIIEGNPVREFSRLFIRHACLVSLSWLPNITSASPNKKITVAHRCVSLAWNSDVYDSMQDTFSFGLHCYKNNMQSTYTIIYFLCCQRRYVTITLFHRCLKGLLSPTRTCEWMTFINSGDDVSNMPHALGPGTELVVWIPGQFQW